MAKPQTTATVIDSSSEEDDALEKESPSIIEMKTLAQRLKQNCSAYKINVKDNDEIAQWRTKLNPFSKYVFLYTSKYAFAKWKDLSTFTNDCLSDIGGKISNQGGNLMINQIKYDSEADAREKSKKEDKYIHVHHFDDLPTSIESASPKNIVVITEEVNKTIDKPDMGMVVPKTPPSYLEDEKVDEKVSEPGGDDVEARIPYYFQNFMHICVMGSDAMRLFNQHEVNCMKKFTTISDAARKLYIRLYQRKRDWFRCDKIHYPKIADDLTLSFQELVDTGYMQNEHFLIDFDDICNLLTAPETRDLANDIKLKVNNGKNNTKADLVKLLKRHCQRQRTIFMSKDSCMKSILSKSAKKYIQKCVRLSEEHSFLFTRVILLFSLGSTQFQEIVPHNKYGTSLLHQMLLLNIGKSKYPPYTINKKHGIFQSRGSLIDYTHAIVLENELDIAVERKDYDAAMKCYDKVKLQLPLILEGLLSQSPEKKEYWLSTPSFLTCFSREWVTIRLAKKCIDILEKQRNYNEAVCLIDLLLAQNVLCSSSRGLLWERLVIDYERYIKDFDKAYLSSVEALKDPYLRVGHRFDILQRYKRLEKSPKVKTDIKDAHASSLIEEINLPREETIRSNIVLESSSKNRAVFLSPATGDGYKLSNVEQHVINHYQEHGFPCGKHGEGSSLTTLYFLLFWDIIFKDVADVFLSEFQNCPLDMFSDMFYLNRKEELNERLKFVYHASDVELRLKIENTWKENYGTYCACVNWELYKTEKEAADVAVCISSKVLGSICELFCKDLRRRTGGFPDIIMWNVEKKTCKIIEVKGPGDKLSFTQMVWLDVLSYLGVDAFVCYVTGIAGKRKHMCSD